MSDLRDITKAYEDGCAEYEKRASHIPQGMFEVRETYGGMAASAQRLGRIVHADNLEYMDYMYEISKEKGAFQLIYVDPPFFSENKYRATVSLKSPFIGKSANIKINAYDDFSTSDLTDYVRMLTVRLLRMRDLLADSGCIVVHLDWHAAHYVKILLDEIFGRQNFINEIIWNYKSGGSSMRSFARKHDTLLLYSKSRNYKFNALKEKSYNRGFMPYRFKGVEEYQDEKGWYTMVNMKDVWNIDMVGRTSAERTGYATQKPEKLLERIVKACSDEGDLCADFFAGSGTFGAVCERLGRPWVMCDESRLAVAAQVARLGAMTGSQGGFTVVSAVNESDAEIEACIEDGYLKLLKYTPSVSVFDRTKSDELERFVSGDSLSLISSWSVDCRWNAGVHHAHKVFDGQERSIEIPEDAEAVHIAGYDALGNYFAGFVKNKKKS